MNIQISEQIATHCPRLCVAALTAEVVNSDNCDALWQAIEQCEVDFRAQFTPETLKQRPGIAATRAAYKALGKDPSRYRPSNEALVRRTLQGKSLYRINTLVDLGNLASIRHGYSIGGFDLDRIEGDSLTLGVGREGEPYEGIGRGTLNIAGLPVYRDRTGGIGTPTSDNERTKIGLDTRRVLFLVNGYDGDEANVRACALYLQHLMTTYAEGDHCDLQVLRAASPLSNS